MSAKNTVEIANHRERISEYVNRYDLQPSAVTLPEFLTSSRGRGNGLAALRQYIDEEKRKEQEEESNSGLLWMKSQAKRKTNCYQQRAQLTMDFQLGFAKDFLESLCRMFASPVLQLQVSLQGKYEDVTPAVVSQQFELQAILASVKLNGDSELTRRFSTEAVEFDKVDFTLNIKLGWEEEGPAPPIQMDRNTLSQSWFGNEATKDLTIIVGNGAKVKCHKVAFAAPSSVLSAMLSPSTGMEESNTGVVKMEENSEDGMKLLLQYFYGIQLPVETISSDLVSELFQTAHKYDLSHQQGSLQNFILKKGGDWFTPNVLVELYFYSYNLDVLQQIKDHCLAIMSRMDKDGLRELRSCDEYKKLDRETAEDLLCTLVEQNGASK